MSSISQRGGFVMGIVIGLLVGLALALGVALYITKAPVPFVNKVPQRTAEQDTAETERNRTWDPNAPLGGKPRAPAAASAAAPASASDAQPAPAVAQPAANPPARDPAAILSGAPVPSTPSPQPQAKQAVQAFDYFVQAGAFARNEDAEQQRAKLAMMGALAKVSEREQAGRVVYRVRVGPYPSREEADNQLTRLQEQNIEAQIVRVEKP